MIKALNLYAGLGGNRKQWENVEVTAVEMDGRIAYTYTQNNPEDKMIVGDAHQYLLDHFEEFDFVWSSPPCQDESRMVKATRHDIRKYPSLVMYQEAIFLKNFFKGKWVVENVKPYYEPLIRPTAILGRHYFWSNFFIPNFNYDNHPNFIQEDSPEGIQKMKDWLGIQYAGNIYYKGNHSPGQVLRNCVHPALGNHVFKSSQRKELSLFNHET